MFVVVPLSLSLSRARNTIDSTAKEAQLTRARSPPSPPPPLVPAAAREQISSLPVCKHKAQRVAARANVRVCVRYLAPFFSAVPYCLRARATPLLARPAHCR
jgi:hypothetical protein